MLVDIHTHLTGESFSFDLERIIKDAESEGVSFLITTGVDLFDSEAAIKIAKKYAIVYANIGLHPHNADEFDLKSLTNFESLIKEDKVCGIGEIGLDFYKNYAKRENQIFAFREFVRLAKKYQLPMNIHLREAHNEGLKILKEENYFKGVLHCFSGSENFLKEAVRYGLYISLSGVITFGSKKLERLLLQIPPELLLLETDAPYLTPVPKRGKRNEPSYIKYVYERVAEILNKDLNSLKEIVLKNARKLFFS